MAVKQDFILLNWNI